MKKLMLALLCILSSTLSKAQVDEFPQVVGDSLVYMLDTATKEVFKTALYDTYYLKLNKYEKGKWYSTVTLMPGYHEVHVFIDDKYFKKTLAHRKALEFYSNSAKIENAKYLSALRKKYGKKFGDAIYYEYGEVGMSSTMLVKAIGRPKKVNRTTTANSVSEQWIYYEVFGVEQTDSRYYYLDNGRLTAIQD